MANQAVLAEIAAKTALLKKEIERLPNVRVFYKWFISGELSKSGMTEVLVTEIDDFVHYWVGQGFYLEQKTQERKSIIWLKIWEYGDREPTWNEVFEKETPSFLALLGNLLGKHDNEH